MRQNETGKNEKNVHVKTLKRSCFHCSLENIKRHVDVQKPNELHSCYVLFNKKNVEARIEAASPFFSQKIVVANLRAETSSPVSRNGRQEAIECARRPLLAFKKGLPSWTIHLCEPCYEEVSYS